MERERCGVTIGAISLAGGQGKTTIILLLGLKLINLGFKVCWIDCDPQANLSLYLNHEGWKERYTILEVLKNEISADQAVYSCLESKAGIIGADESLANINHFLAESGNAANLLKKRLKSILKRFDFFLIDTPPSQTQIGLSAIGACQLAIIPIETTVKGSKGLIHTLKSLQTYEELGTFNGTILGIIPFRERWFGHNLATESKKAKETIQSIADLASIPLLPSLIESETYKRSIVSCSLPSAILNDSNKSQIDHPIDVLADKLLKTLNT